MKARQDLLAGVERAAVRPGQGNLKREEGLPASPSDLPRATRDLEQIDLEEWLRAPVHPPRTGRA